MKYICQICGYVYDDEKEEIPFNELPDDWKCPLCKAPKSAFKPEEEKENVDIKIDNHEEFKLNIGELSALCSNLARGCEKQYLFEESKLFNELAINFDRIKPKENNKNVNDLLELVNNDLNKYKGLKEYTLKNEDRGAARVSVWGEKVTRMLKSLLDSYINKGEDMLKDTNVYVCTVCGFIYIGDEAPELCPVCKVPSWKFEKMEGLK